MTDHNDARAKAVEAARIAHNAEMLQPRYGLDRAPDPVAAAIDTFERTMAEAGWVRVPREPTLDMLEDGYEAMRIARSSGISGMTTEAQTRNRCSREGNVYRAMVSAAMLTGRDGEEG